MHPSLQFLLAVNLIGFLAASLDKHFARRHMWRVPEHMLFLLSVFGGGAGVYAALLLFRHKTRRPSFMIGIPAILVCQLALLYFTGL